MLIPFLPYHLDSLGFSTRTTGWIVAAFGAGYLIGQIACGWLSDRIGQRATLVTAMAAAASSCRPSRNSDPLLASSWRRT
ncbi:MFS transporter [Streptomyces sp. NPDC058409]|uniref:MFS transporter n=1 Tax=Streptomyces sp. NPDC058409 TaxID=3346484 RepID=UPI003669EB8D